MTSDPKFKRVIIAVDSVVTSAINDVISLSKAELRAERLVEHCIYQFLGYPDTISYEDALGYGCAKEYMSDEEYCNFVNDVKIFDLIVQGLCEKLSRYLCQIDLTIGPLTGVRVTGLTAILTFRVENKDGSTH